MEIALNRWNVGRCSNDTDSIIHELTNIMSYEIPFDYSDIMSVANRWAMPLWCTVFFMKLKKHGVKCCYVCNEKNKEKFYAVVESCTIEKMTELSDVYINFLEICSKVEEDPYFEFIVFGRDELSVDNLGKGFRKME